MIFVNQSAYGRRFLDQTAAIGLRSMGSAGGHSVNHSIRPSARLAPSKSARSTVCSPLLSSPPLPLTPPAPSAKVCVNVCMYACSMYLRTGRMGIAPLPVLCLSCACHVPRSTVVCPVQCTCADDRMTGGDRQGEQEQPIPGHKHTGSVLPCPGKDQSVPYRPCTVHMYRGLQPARGGWTAVLPCPAIPWPPTASG